MNSRIKEFAEQAGLTVESWMTHPPKPFQILGSSKEFEKFAKLIVQECAGIYDKIDNGNLHMGTDNYLEALRKTFQSAQ